MEENVRIERVAKIDLGSNKTLISMVGLPYSGKSTLARSLGYPMVCPDAIRVALHGQRYVRESEPHVWAIARTMVNALFMAGHRYVILDATGMKRRDRDSWTSQRYETRFCHVDTPKSECIKRALGSNEFEDGDVYIVPVIEKMDAEFEPLENDELRWIIR